MKVAVIIVNYRTAHLVGRALSSIPHGYGSTSDVKAIVVDGFSNDGSLQLLEAMVSQSAFRGWVELLPLDINGGFGWANNQAIMRVLQGPNPPDLIHLLNPDAELLENSGRALVERCAVDSGIGAVGSQLIESDGTLAASAFRFPTVLGEFGRGAATQVVNRLLRIKDTALPKSPTAVQVDWVTGASVMFKADALKETGLFDDSLFLYHEEVELMRRLNLSGWTIWHEPKSRVRHLGGAATGIRHLSGTRVQPPRPDYWYNSRVRMFDRIHGRGKSWAAIVAWLAGYGLWSARRMLNLQGGHSPVEGEARALVQAAIRSFRDRPQRVTNWNDPPGRPPQWLSRAK